MPPAGRSRPDAAATASLVSWLETGLDAEAAANPDPGTPAIHRLNRAEYRNAVRDLLGLDLDHARDLPADDSGYGFDNIGDVLTVSPLHVEQYVAAARRVSRVAVGSLAPRPVVERYEPPDGTTDEAIDGLPPNERGGILFRHYFAFDADYTFTVRVRGRRTTGMPPPRLDVRVDGRRVRLIDADFDPEEANQLTRNFELRLPLPAGEHEIGAGFLTEYARSEDGAETNGYSVDYVLVEGPYDAAGPGETDIQRRVFVCRPAANEPEERCARRILQRLARRAYRRPVTAADIDPLLDLFAMGRTDGERFEDGIEMALSGVLISPSFLFRAPRAPENGEPGSAYPLSDIDLASRLSFFLWSSIPDEELLDLAEHGRLGDPPVFASQLARMLADPKSTALVKNFGGQWLHLRNVADWTPDPVRFADFDDSLRYAFERETAALSRPPDPRGPQRPGADRRRLHVPERAPGRLLRHRRRERRLLPTRPARGHRARRRPDARQRVDGHLVPDADIAGAARQVGAGEPARRAAPRHRRPTCRPWKPARRIRPAACARRWSGTGPIPPAPPATRSSTRSGSRWRTSTRSARTERRTRAWPSRRRGRCPTAPSSTAPRGCAACCGTGATSSWRRWPGSC